MDPQSQNQGTQIIDMITSPKKLWAFIKFKATHPSVQKHTANMGWMFFGRIGSMIITLIATSYMARNLGPTNYGQLSYAVSYVGLFAFISSLGVEQILYRDLIKFPEKRNEYMGSAITIRFLASILAIVVCVTSAYIWSSKDVSLFLIFIVSLTYVLGTLQLSSYEFQAEAKAKLPSILSLIIIFILNILKIGVIVFGEGIIYLAFVILVEPFLYSVGLLYLRIKEYGTIKYWRFDYEIAKSILKDSFPLIFASAFFALYARVDQIMIKHMLNTESVGLYDSAVRISELGYFVPNIIVVALFPALVNSKKISFNLYTLRAKKLLFMLLLISFIIALVTALLSKYLVLIIFGAGFIGAVLVLKVYVWSNIGAALNLLIHQLLVVENLTKIVTVSIFAGMVSNVALNFILIPKYGMLGAATASLISYFMPTVSLLFFKSSRKMLSDIFIRK